VRAELELVGPAEGCGGQDLVFGGRVGRREGGKGVSEEELDQRGRVCAPRLSWLGPLKMAAGRISCNRLSE